VPEQHAIATSFARVEKMSLSSSHHGDHARDVAHELRPFTQRGRDVGQRSEGDDRQAALLERALQRWHRIRCAMNR
jgi:hypothetical protein